MKLFRTILFIALLLIPASVYADSSLFFLTNGNQVRPNVTTWKLLIPQLGGTGTRCAQVDNNGLFSVAAAACGSGGGGGGITGIEVRAVPGGTKLINISSLSFDNSSFNVVASGSTDSRISIDYVNGPASRSIAQTISGQWAFSSAPLGFTVTNSASISANLEVVGYASASFFKGSAFPVSTCNGNNSLQWATTGLFSCSGLFQTQNASLTALAALAGNGIVVQTGANTFTNRSVVGTTNQISVSNGDGVSGNPTLSVPSLFSITTASLSANLEVGGYASTSSLFIGQNKQIQFSATQASLSIPFEDTVYASAAQYFGAGLISCTGSNVIQWTAGLFSCSASGAGITAQAGVAATEITFFQTSGIVSGSSQFQWDSTNKRLGINYGAAIDTTFEVGGIASIGGNLYVLKSGNIGIGTTNPGALLDATGTAAGQLAAGQFKNTTGSGDVAVTFQNGVNAGTIIFDGTSTAPTNGYRFTQGGNTRMSLTSTGNLGIGTTNPLGVLDVRGTASISGDFSINNTAFTVIPAIGYVGIGSHSFVTGTTFKVASATQESDFVSTGANASSELDLWANKLNTSNHWTLLAGGNPGGNDLDRFEILNNNAPIYVIASDSHPYWRQAIAPTAGSCATSPAIARGSTDAAGEIKVGSTPGATCVVNFAKTWIKRPSCAISQESGAVGFAAGESTTTTLTITGAATLVAASYSWVCYGYGTQP